MGKRGYLTIQLLITFSEVLLPFIFAVLVMIILELLSAKGTVGPFFWSLDVSERVEDVEASNIQQPVWALHLIYILYIYKQYTNNNMDYKVDPSMQWMTIWLQCAQTSSSLKKPQFQSLFRVSPSSPHNCNLDVLPVKAGEPPNNQAIEAICHASALQTHGTCLGSHRPSHRYWSFLTGWAHVKGWCKLFFWLKVYI